MVKLPGGSAHTTSLNKMDIVQKHVTAAIQMITINANPFSTHLVVMSAEEMIRQLAAARDIELTTDYKRFVKDEFHKDYLRKFKKSYNWFKHADLDADAVYDGPEPRSLRKVNDIQTLVNIMGYFEISGEKAVDAFSHYTVYLSLKYPEYMKDDYLSDLPDMRRQYESLCREPHSIAIMALQQLLAKLGFLPRIK